MSGRVPGVVVALAIAAFTSTVAQAEDVAVSRTASVAPVQLPGPKQGGRELKDAFGKDWEADVQQEIQGDLTALKLFDVVPSGGDWTLALSFDELRRKFDDRVAVSGRGTLRFETSGRWTWTQGGNVVKEGKFEVGHSVTLERQPWRSDLESGWRDVLRGAVSEAVSGAELAR